MHTVCQHVLSAITGDQCMRFGGATPSSIIGMSFEFEWNSCSTRTSAVRQFTEQ
ncbi:hypothetical protein AB205_0194060, partial [Aquarana catesbeiana]